MNLKNQILFSFFLLFYRADAFNITQFVSQYSDFSTFNDYLTQTKVADDINSRQTITVLAVDNGNISPLSGKPANVLKSIMSVHVILDYFDVQKLQNLPNRSIITTTLFQTTGLASGQQGFLNVTDLATGSVVFGSAAKGATLGANLVKSIAAQPYNISVLQISTVIIPLGIDNSKANSSTPAPTASPTPPKSPPAPSPANSSAVSPPMPGPVPVNSTPVSPPKPGPAPMADAPAADAAPANTPPNGAGSALWLSHGSFLLIVFSALWLFATI